MHYKIGTRKSQLSLAQTQHVLDRLAAAYPDDSFEIVTITTTGDRHTDRPLDQLGTRGVFVDEIELALTEGRIQLAVHSMKDIPAEPADGLIFADAWEREDPRDALVLREAASLSALPQGAVIGTGSKRRACQLLSLRPDLRIVPIRGNLDTRLRKLREESHLDGIVVAAAGMKRLGREDEITQYLTTEEMIPAPAQGALAIELRAADTELLTKLNALSSPAVSALINLERGFLQAIGGDCHLPIGAYAERTKTGFRLRGLFGRELVSPLMQETVRCASSASAACSSPSVQTAQSAFHAADIDNTPFFNMDCFKVARVTVEDTHPSEALIGEAVRRIREQLSSG